MPRHIETSQLIYITNQLIGFWSSAVLKNLEISQENIDRVGLLVLKKTFV